MNQYPLWSWKTDLKVRCSCSFAPNFVASSPKLCDMPICHVPSCSTYMRKYVQPPHKCYQTPYNFVLCLAGLASIHVIIQSCFFPESMAHTHTRYNIWLFCQFGDVPWCVGPSAATKDSGLLPSRVIFSEKWPTWMYIGVNWRDLRSGTTRVGNYGAKPSSDN